MNETESMIPLRNNANNAAGNATPIPSATVASLRGTHSRAHVLWLAAMLGAVAAWLIFRNAGLNPAVFADEWYYSKMTRMVPLAESILPSYLYLWLFSASNACGAGFLECVRVGNVLLYVAAGPFIYGIARQVTSRLLSWVVVLLAMMAPANSYTAYFMPEATYYFGFAVLSWTALTRSHWGWALHAAATGAVIGLMSLVKVHALFLLPALCVFLMYQAWTATPAQARWLKAFTSAAIAGTTAIALKFGLGYLLAGENGLSLFGSFYSGTANSATGRLATLLPLAFINARGHLMALALLAAMPLAILALHLTSAKARAEAGRERSALYVYTVLMMGAAVGLTVAFTASIADQGPDEILRLHLRYYSFLMPLLFIVAAAPISEPGAARSALRWPVAIALIAVLAIAMVKLPTYSITPIDGPELAALDLRRWDARAVAGLGMIVLILWAMRSKAAAPLFMFCALPAMTAAGAMLTAAHLGHHAAARPADVAGKYVHDHVPASEHKLVTVAGPAIHDNMRALFHIDDPDTLMLHLAPGAGIEKYQIPASSKWLLALGSNALPAGLTAQVSTPEFQLARLSPVTRRIGGAQFAQPYEEGIVASAEGLSEREAMGRWSDGKHVVLLLREPLPAHAVVILRAFAFAENAGLPFKMQVGDAVREFRLGPTVQEIALEFVTDGAQRRIAIEVPRPLAPADISGSVDQRKLGIALTELAIAIPPAQ